ncbi:MAG: hypothetical protein ACXWQO_06895 [Bdellovibrionota bacterium]
MGTFSFPSKTFLLGEYAVLREGSALMLAHDPCFKSELCAEPLAKPAFVEACAAGKAAALLGVDLSHLKFQDPHEGKGGFGGSGAEFLSVLAAKWNAAPGATFAWEAWDLYRRLGCTGSGADVLTQASTAPGNLVHLNIPARKLEFFNAGRLGLQLTLFHTGHKLPTHQHLKEAYAIATHTLATLVEKGVDAYRSGNREGFLAAIKSYAQALENRQLVAQHAAEALESLSALTEALAAKGCGALGSDVLLVCTEKQPSAALQAWAAKHSLVEVASLPI